MQIEPEASPLIKWAGGKRKLLPHIVEALFGPEGPREHDVYVEPFLGGGAVALALGRQVKQMILADKNARLINMYTQVRDKPEQVAEKLREYECRWREVEDDESRRKNTYYRHRDALNAETDPLPTQAANFIFVNKTCFNGLYRENKNGGFNVPVGSGAVSFPSDEDIHSASSALQKSVLMTSAREAFRMSRYSLDVNASVFVYADPPYFPLDETADFTSYTPDGFGMNDHRHLNAAATFLSMSGAHVCLSGYAHGVTRETYKDGTLAKTIDVRRSISCGERNKVQEGIYYYGSRT